MTTEEVPLLDLRKKMVLDLKKSKGIRGQQAQVALVLDYSGSMSTLYNNGTVQKTIDRILPIGLGFDDNGEVDAYLFHNGYIKIDKTININNYTTFVKDKTSKFGMGGTDYAPVIMKILEDYIGDLHISAPVVEEQKGFFGKISNKLFGSDTSAKPTSKITIPNAKKLNVPVYVIFITDGENSDHEAARNAIQLASKFGIFFQFVGIGHESFKFLKELDTMGGRVIDNANFLEIKDLNTIDDSSLYNKLMFEFPSWIVLAQQKGIIT